MTPHFLSPSSQTNTYRIWNSKIQTMWEISAYGRRGWLIFPFRHWWESLHCSPSEILYKRGILCRIFLLLRWRGSRWKASGIHEIVVYNNIHVIVVKTLFSHLPFLSYTHSFASVTRKKKRTNFNFTFMLRS